MFARTEGAPPLPFEFAVSLHPVLVVSGAAGSIPAGEQTSLNAINSLRKGLDLKPLRALEKPKDG
jgi:hypothetical protein